jgi:DNA-binding transcriptional ArsR family regulator
MALTGRVFKALADPTRRQILQELKAGEMAAGDIVALFEISGPAVSRHLAILKAADLVTERRDGNRLLYRLEAETLANCLSEFIGSVCLAQITVRKQLARRKGKS